MSNLLVIRGTSSQKTINSLDKFAFLVCLWQFSLFFNAQKWIAPIAHLPFFKEWFERFAHSHSLKRVTVSNSFRSIMTKEQLLAIRSGCLGRSWQKSNGSDSLFFMSELLFRSQKTSKFPTLLSTLLRKYFAICSVLLYMYITICLPSSCWIWVRNFSCVYFANRYLFAEPLPPSPSGNTFYSS